jgi:hypothetical protein
MPQINGSQSPLPVQRLERPQKDLGIVSPLAEALARASVVAPPQQVGPHPSSVSPPPPIAGSPIPALLRSDTPTILPPAAPPPLPVNGNGSGFPSEPSTQPDFSTLPPSIAASLARLAGTPLPSSGKTGGGPAQRTAENIPGEAQKASKANG